MKRHAYTFLMFLAIACKESPPEPPKPATLSLRVEDASCTEAWLKASVTQPPATVRLLRDGQRRSVLRLLTSDSLLLDEGLLPRRTYTYQLQRLAADSSVVETSASVQLTTMDTTSHNWSFSIDTLGVTASSLQDVAIVSENDVWAVGELYLNDSTGQLDPILYNAAHWDGVRWNIIRIPYIYQGSPTYGTIRWIFALNKNDIWFGNSVHWDGQRFHNVDIGTSIFFGIGSNKMWGSPDGKLYVVGNSGTIAYSPDHGSTWRRVESGTSVDVQDAWGGSNSLVGGRYVLLPASNVLTFGQKKLLRINENGILDSIIWGMPNRRLRSVWFNARSKVYVCGGGVFAYTGARWKEYTEVPLIFTRRIRGKTENDIIVVGDFGLLAHYNGDTWRTYPEADVALWESVDVKRNIAIAVGSRNGTARIAILTR